MNKKILAAAIAVSIAAPMAVAADVTVYGIAHMSMDQNETDTGTGVTAGDVDNWQANSRASRLGFKGSEDLGNGLKANFQLELGFDMDGTGLGNTNSASAPRNTWVGISGDFGEIRFGRHDTPAKVASYAAGIETIGDSIIDNNRKDGDGKKLILTDERANGALAYISPNMSGFQFVGAVVPGESTNDGGADDTGNDGISDTYSLGAWYKNAGLAISAAYESNAGDNNAPDQDAWLVSAGYTIDALTVAAHYEDVSDFGNVRGQDRDTITVMAKYAMGNNTLIANYQMSETDNNGTQVTDVDAWGIGLQHSFSKRTSAYVAYSDLEDDQSTATTDDYERTEFSIGLVHKF